MSDALDNRFLIAPFVPETFDGDTFIYTELLNRTKRAENNKGRLERTFYHRSRAEFFEQMPDIVKWCEYTGARAYTRLAPRSFRKVAAKFATHVMEQVLAENWEGMRHGYAHCTAISKPLTKYWLFDVDAPSTTWHQPVNVVAQIPSRKGYHVIVRPFDMRGFTMPEHTTLHKDNPTNLYIPVSGA